VRFENFEDLDLKATTSKKKGPQNNLQMNADLEHWTKNDTVDTELSQQQNVLGNEHNATNATRKNSQTETHIRRFGRA
jgi:hypothetical protein